MIQEEGVPQGSVLSVTCFALAINSLPQCTTEGVRSSLYVDDFVIYTASNHMPAAERRLQRTINNIIGWTNCNGFRFCVDKTVVMTFQATKKFNREPDIYMNRDRLKAVEEKKFLGLVWDKKLTWIAHLKSLKKKCMKRLDLLKCMSYKDWGADKEVMLRIYRALIRSKLDYGCQAYASAKPHDLNMLDAVHHAGIRLSLGAFRSSPVQSMYVEAVEPSLDYRRSLVGLQHFIRLLRLPNSPCTNIVHEDMDLYNEDQRNVQKPFGIRMKMLLNSLNLNIANVLEANGNLAPWLAEHQQSPCTHMTKYSKAGKSNNALKYLFAHHIESHSDSLHVYTDGSKTATGVGCAAVFPERTRTIKLPNEATIFSAELEAIRVTLIESLNIRNRNFTIMTDSLSAIQAINDFNHQSPLVVKIQNSISENSRMHKEINFCWVPSHAGIVGNERADVAAKRAAESNEVVNVPLPHSDFYPLYRKALKEKWQSEWDGQRNNKLHDIKPTIKKMVHFQQ